jgi:hypothetical protein
MVAAVTDGGGYPIAAFFNGDIGQADDDNLRLTAGAALTSISTS